MQLLVMNLAICLALIVIAWAIRYIRRHPEWLIMQDPEDNQNPMVLKMVSTHWDLRAEINDALTRAELESLYWKVEAFEATFRNLVPDTALTTYTDALYAAVAEQRDKILGHKQTAALSV